MLESYAPAVPRTWCSASPTTRPATSRVLGAVALGARVVEKHFTDDTGGPARTTASRWTRPPGGRWSTDARDLESALGSPLKKVEDNEVETVVLQRRCLRAGRDLPAGTVLTTEDVEVLRPATPGALPPGAFDEVVGRTVRHDLVFGQELTWSALD